MSYDAVYFFTTIANIIGALATLSVWYSTYDNWLFLIAFVSWIALVLVVLIILSAISGD